MGSAIECFTNSGAVVVPRSRFAPVKTCNDLFVLRSDAYKVTEAYTVELDAEKAPLAKLDDDHYKLVDQMEALVEAPPSMQNCSKLTVKGPVKFLKGVTLQGDVSITNNGSSPVELAAGEYMDTTLDITTGAPVPA